MLRHPTHGMRMVLTLEEQEHQNQGVKPTWPSWKGEAREGRPLLPRPPCWKAEE